MTFSGIAQIYIITYINTFCQVLLAGHTTRREKYDYYQTHPEEVEKILAEGGAKAKQRAEETMKKVRKITGLTV